MIEEELSRAVGRSVSRETMDMLVAYVALLKEENGRQNLISTSTINGMWSRHIVDSAQLVSFAPSPAASWADIGSGAGLPGIVIACLVKGPVALIEPRRLRADFLHKVSESLNLNVTIHPTKAAHVSATFDMITARAVAPLAKMLELSHHLSTGKTVWALPKGRSAASELAEARRGWQGEFHVERSITDEEASIVVATGVRRR